MAEDPQAVTAPSQQEPDRCRIIRWAREVKPRIIILENVEEFQTWGPLDENDRPIKERMGETFREWLFRHDRRRKETRFHLR